MAARRTSTFRCTVKRMTDVLHDLVPSCVAEDRRFPNHPNPKQCHGSKSPTENRLPMCNVSSRILSVGLSTVSEQYLVFLCFEIPHGWIRSL